MAQLNLAKPGKPKVFSRWFRSQACVVGSDGYPLPLADVSHSGRLAGSSVDEEAASSYIHPSIQASRVTFAAIDAALTMGNVESAFLSVGYVSDDRKFEREGELTAER